jgi:hypothetical protein
MIAYIRADKGLGNEAIYVRLRGVTGSDAGKFWDFSNSQWVDIETPACGIYMHEYPDSDSLESLYLTELSGNLPSECIQEAVLKSNGSVLGYDYYEQGTDNVIIITPSDPDVCTIYELCFLADDKTPMPKIEAEARIYELPYDYNGKLHAGIVIPHTYKDGIVSWTIVKGAKVRFKIKDIYPSLVFATVPNALRKRLKELIA